MLLVNHLCFLLSEILVHLLAFNWVVFCFFGSLIIFSYEFTDLYIIQTLTL